MDEFAHRPTLRIKRQDMELILKHSEMLNNLFSVRVTNLLESDACDSNYVHMALEWDEGFANNLPRIAQKLQSYVDKLCNQAKDHDEGSLGGEDSSYDSDFEGEDSKSHQDVSRTVSDTLAAEFSEYVSESTPDSTNYTAKVEFGLKLGYTEKHVQAALCKLGPNPSQNELLAELIKLGAQSPKSSEPETVGLDDGSFLEWAPVRLRPIVIDGSNVAMSHGNKEVFSCKGIKICVDWFKSRGHKEITVFVPKWRKEASRPDNLISDQEILTELEKERIVVFTPSRLVGGKRTVCYDDRYILRLAAEVDGIVVSNDNYRDLAQENAEFRKVVEERTLMYSFVNDRFMPPDDPLGRSGPTLDNFLKIQVKRSDPAPPCPYGKKCTYGNKCKYNHPERGSMPHKSVTERLVEHAQKHWQARGSRDMAGGQLKGKSLSVPLSTDDPILKQGQQHGTVKKNPLTRTKSGNPTCSFMKNSNSDSDGGCKSKSVENILNDKGIGQAMRGNVPYWKNIRTCDRQYPQMLGQQGSGCVGPTANLSPAEPDSVDVTANLHRKLERQLSLNPYDRRMGGEDWTSQPQWRGYAARVPYDGSYWEHQNVTRISSAPGSCLPDPPQTAGQRQMQRLSSTSDSHLNLCAPEVPNYPDPFETRTWIPANVPMLYSSNTGLRLPTQVSHTRSHLDSYSKEEARRKLHYHLSSIFPEEQVRAALQMHPEETKPQEICAAILAMFPKQ